MDQEKKLVWFANPPRPDQDLFELTWGYVIITPEGIKFDDSIRPTDEEIQASDLYQSEMEKRRDERK